jgi:Domain of unknown function (DUF4440)
VSPFQPLCAACLALAAAATVRASEPTAAALQRSTQALMDATAPGNRAVWAHYADAQFVYVTEDNEVKTRTQVLADLTPLPPGYSGWITVEQFRCHDFGRFAVTTYLIDEHETIEGHELHAYYRSSDTWRRTHAGWRLAASQEFAVPQDPPRATATSTQLADYEGLYSLSALTRQTIRREGDHLIAERPGRAAQALLRESGDVFFTPGHPRTRRIFTRAGDGEVSGFADRREGADLVWTRVAPEPTAR